MSLIPENIGWGGDGVAGDTASMRTQVQIPSTQVKATSSGTCLITVLGRQRWDPGAHWPLSLD